MITSITFRPISLNLSDYKTYLFTLVFVVGNLVLPQLCHLIPDGGKILLPIYFFTLIASYKFGIKAGLMTAILSPLCNYLLFGMPTLALLPVILIKSSLLAIAAAWMAHYSKKVSVFHLAAVVIAYQLTGAVAEYFITGSLALAMQDFRLALPGIFIQIVGGWLVLKALAKYEF